MSLVAGTRLGPYEIVGPLGAGGMGEVFRARDTRLGRDVAIKVLPPEFAADPERLRRFEQEARATAVLDHPNILAVYDVGTLDGAPYIVEQLLEGESLRGRLERGPLSVREAVGTAIQIAQGLAAAHGKGIVHRDLKPANVFITSEGPVKILDFGIAKLAPPRSAEELAQAATLVEATEAGTVLGTVGYMSPEQVLGKPVDARSDLFSLGVVLYEMLSGTRPFQKESAPETMAAILNEEPPDLAAIGKGIPPGLARMVGHCLEKRPEDRVQSARDLAFDLALLSQPFDTAAGAVAPVRPAPRRLLPLATAVAVGAVAVAVGVFLLGRGTAHPPQPTFQRLTFHRGWVGAARFAPDGQTVVYSAAWEGRPDEVFSLRLGSPESRPLGYTPAELLAVSRSGELALSLRSHSLRSSLWLNGTLARVALSGGTPRPLEDGITFADWSPDGTELAVVRQDAERDQLEYPSGHVVYSTAGMVSSPRVSPRGTLVAFIDHPFPGDEMGAVAVVDRAGKKTTLTGTFMGTARGLAWSPEGDEIWFTAVKTGLRQELRAVTLDGRERLVLAQAVPIRVLDVAKDGRILVAHDQLASRVFFRGEKDSNDRELSWLDWSQLGGISRDGRFVVLREWGEGAAADVLQTFVRETNGAPPMKLGRGEGLLSPDERSVVATVLNPPAIVVYPVGTGQPREISMEGLTIRDAILLRDGRTIAFNGREPSHGNRIWVTDLSGSKPRPITAEGVFLLPQGLPPDGRSVLAVSSGKRLLYPIAGGEPRPLLGFLEGDAPRGWSADGESYFAFRGSDLPWRVYRVNGRTGDRQLEREIMPGDLASRLRAGNVILTPDGKSYAYEKALALSELYMIEGVR